MKARLYNATHKIEDVWVTNTKLPSKGRNLLHLIFKSNREQHLNNYWRTNES